MVVMNGGPGIRISLTLRLAAAGCLAAGCAGAPASSASVKLTGAEIAVLTTSSGTALAAAEVNNAYEVLVQRCMESQGFVYYLRTLTAADFGGLGLPGLPQASTSLAAREVNGYGIYSRAVQDAANPGGAGGGLSQEELYIRALSAATQPKYVMALSGPESRRISVTLPGGGTASVTTGGCQGREQRQIYGSATNYLLAVTGQSLLADQLYKAVTTDPALVAVVAKWSKCMAEHGFKYSSPVILWNSLYTRIHRRPTLALRNLEIRVAVTDYKCAMSVALVAT